jgi:hypothetical protein
LMMMMMDVCSQLLDEPASYEATSTCNKYLPRARLWFITCQDASRLFSFLSSIIFFYFA